MLTIKLEVGLDTGSSNGLGNHTRASLQAPHQQDLSGGLVLCVGDLLECLVLCERTVRRSEARVCSGMNTLLLAVIEEFWAGVVRVQFNLVHCWGCFAAWIVQKLLKVLDGEVRDTDV